MTRRLWISLLLCAAAGAAFAQHQTVTRVTVVARPRTFGGPCPAHLLFQGSIYVSRPARVTYVWERSDGARGERQTVDIHGPAHTVNDPWTVGGRHEHLSVWERLHVLAPTNMLSAPSHVAIRCR